MAEQAIILIPDISGFTGFTGATEIDHAAHIITELLELIVASNETDFTLAEIEGDAVLFYRKGEPLQREQLIDQCLRMFANFQQRLMVIERDTVCQCGACQTASNLTLKFIVHFGYIKEIKVAQFVKATGIDMIVAHRLLKNDVGAQEYILITEPCCAAVGQDDANPKFQWAKSSQAYETIGNVAYEFATLTGYKAHGAATLRRGKRRRQSGGRDQCSPQGGLSNIDKRRQTAGLAGRRQYNRPRDDLRAHQHAAQLRVPWVEAGQHGRLPRLL
jgi:hypothetical protein